MSDKNKPQPKAFRITEETAEKFRIISQELGANQQQAMAKLIEVYEMEKGKEAIPDMRSDIDTFEGYMHAMVNMYMQALETNQNMRALVRTEYDALLKSKDKMIEELQKRLEQAEEMVNQAVALKKECDHTMKEAQTECEKLNKQLEEERLATEEKWMAYEHRYNNLENMYAKLQASDEETKNLLSSFLKENEKLKSENLHMQEEQRTLNTDIMKLTHSNKILTKELRTEKETTQKNFEDYKTNIDIQHRLALQIKENEMKDTHKKELDALRAELDKYKELYYNSRMEHSQTNENPTISQ